MLTGKDTTKVEFIESYIKHGAGDYEWVDNHGELIRCKDCKHVLKGSHIRQCCRDMSHWQKVDDNWFCAGGERRTDDD